MGLAAEPRETDNTSQKPPFFLKFTVMQIENNPVHHLAVYNDKIVSMDYIKDPKQEFKYACMRIIDNGASGTVICPNGKKYQITQGSKKAKLIQ